MPAREQPETPSPEAGGWFQTTHWSVVLSAGQTGAPRAAESLEELCRVYWRPLFAFIRRSGHDEETAKDLTQGFFARLVEKQDLAAVNRDRGRFRSFLLASAKHFLANEWDRQQAQRRGGGAQFLSFDSQVLAQVDWQDANSQLSPEIIFERRWAAALLETVRAKLASEYSSTGKEQIFAALHPYLSGNRGEAPYAETAAGLGMSVDAVKKAVERLRRRYGELLRREVAATVSDPAEIDDEIRHLLKALQS